jgi:hypothetical protein
MEPPDAVPRAGRLPSDEEPYFVPDGDDEYAVDNDLDAEDDAEESKNDQKFQYADFRSPTCPHDPIIFFQEHSLLLA